MIETPPPRPPFPPNRIICVCGREPLKDRRCIVCRLLGIEWSKFLP